jgi:hypothetical protein
MMSGKPSGPLAPVLNHSISGEISCLSRSAGGFDPRMVLQFQSAVISIGRIPASMLKWEIMVQIHVGAQIMGSRPQSTRQPQGAASLSPEPQRAS